jgi:hypothetical protein
VHLLADQHGGEGEALEAYRQAVATNVPNALRRMASWLGQQGREAAAEALYREAVATGDEPALGLLLAAVEGSGRSAEADRIRRFGLDAYGATAQPDSE